MFSMIIRNTELGQPWGPCGEAGSSGEELVVVVPEGEVPPVNIGGANDIPPDNEPDA